nr:probable membrane-associated kinase regulator 6 [Ipomoea batatas]
MDPTLPPSQRFFSVSLSDFSNFDFPVSESSLTLFHADELISNGFLVPLFAQPIKSNSFDRAFDSPEKPTKQDQLRSSDEEICCALLKRCRRLSRRIFRRYLDVADLCQTAKIRIRFFYDKQQFEEAPPLEPSLPIIPIQGAEEFHFQNTPIADDAIQDPSSPMAGQIREVSPINNTQQSESSGGMAPAQNPCDDQSSTHTTTDSGQTPPTIPPRRSTRPRQVPNKLHDYYCGTLAQGRTSPHALSKAVTSQHEV